MPKRSNFFQKLIYALHKQLSDTATVTESKLLKDKETGSLVEVDIVIESNVGGIPIVIGVECTSKSRPATLEWYRQLVQKHSDLPISKTVLVSESGFSKDVYKKAKINNVDLLTLDEAIDTNWLNIVKKINNGKMVNITFKPKEISIHFNKDDIKSSTNISFDHNSEVEESGNTYNLVDYSNQLVKRSGLTRWVLENYSKLPENCRSFNTSIEMNTEPKRILSDKSKIIIRNFDITMEFSPTESNLNFTSGKYSNKNIAYSEFNNIFSKSKSNSTLSFIQDINGEVKGQLTYIDDNQNEANLKLEIIDHAFKNF